MIKKLSLAIAYCYMAAATTAQDIPKLKMTDVVERFSKKSDSILVINFWATFCKPCVAEIPGFIKVTNKYKKDKVKLLLVSLDLPSFYPKRIAAFATKNNFNASIAWLDETKADYFCPMIDKAWSGAIPATIIVNTKTGYKKFFEAEMKEEDFEKELQKAIGENTSLIKSPKFLMPMNNVILADYFDPEKAAFTPSYSTTFKSKDSSVYSITEGKVSTVADN